MQNTHFLLGAINKDTNIYEYSLIAIKESKYICPDCNQNVYFKKENIKRTHFCHKIGILCNYYDKPTESQLHKEGKNLLGRLLNYRQLIKITKSCINCDYEYNIDIKYTNTTKIKKEYYFKHTEKKFFGDIVLLYDDKIRYISENNRFCEWFELNSRDLIQNVNDNINYPIQN
jgi:hypothetical protein